jgi:hypothetical protein
MDARWIGWTMGTLGFLLCGATTASAQSSADYNSARAYRHFLMSRYSYRTLSSSIPGQGGVSYGPFGYESQFVEPAFSRQWITPYGYGRFDWMPGSGGTTVTPFGYSNYYAPGYASGYYVPFRRPPVNGYFYP